MGLWATAEFSRYIKYFEIKKTQKLQQIITGMVHYVQPQGDPQHKHLVG